MANISGGLLTTEEHRFTARSESSVNLFGTKFRIDSDELTELVYASPAGEDVFGCRRCQVRK